MDRTTQSDSVKEFTHQDLVKVDRPGEKLNHPYWFENPITKKKVYRKGTIKISTGEISIKKAKLIVQIELDRRAGLGSTAMARARKGVTNHLLKDCWADLVASRTSKRAGSTVIKYGVSWRHAIKPFWGEMTCAQISQSTQDAFETWYMENRPTKQFFNVRKHLGMLFHYLRMQGLINTVPVIADLDERIDKVVERKKVGRVYSKAEQKALIAATMEPYSRLKGHAAKNWPWQLRARVAILFGLEGGLRKMEIGKLKLININLTKGAADVWSQKNGSWRQVPMGPDLVEAVKELIAHNPKSEYLFPMPSNPARHLSSQNLDKAWHSAKERAGIEGGMFEARFHDLRHTFATRTSKEKWSIIMACKVLDMSAKEYQRTYTHTCQSDIEAEMARTFGWDKDKSK